MNDFEVRDETMKIQDFQAIGVESKINYLHESTKCATNPIFLAFSNLFCSFELCHHGKTFITTCLHLIQLFRALQPDVISDENELNMFHQGSVNKQRD